ncbi:MAG: phospholipase [Cyanobacteria bacterium J06623_7]
MSKKNKIDDVKEAVEKDGYFFDLSELDNYVRILDTPKVWGEPFGQEIMPKAWERQAEFERAIIKIIQRVQYRCDVSFLNVPDPDWGKVILAAMDQAISNQIEENKEPIQFRFLFGQTPMHPLGEPPNYTDFKAALIRLIRRRFEDWKNKPMPEILMGRFSRLIETPKSALASQGESVSEDSILSTIVSSIHSNLENKLTWNHSKIIAVDGSEALVGGHNLNMDLFRSYPPVHDVSVVVHGEAAYGSQKFLNLMWECGPDLLTVEYLNIQDIKELSWEEYEENTIKDPLTTDDASLHMKTRWGLLNYMHQEARRKKKVKANFSSKVKPNLETLDDLLNELKQPVFPERIVEKNHVNYFDEDQYENLQDYRLATRIFSVGKYWTDKSKKDNFQKGSEIMKEVLIKKAKNSIKMSQMDLISVWKKNWSDHVVCQWLIEALLNNKNLEVQVVVSPLDAGAGAEGDQYSFGSGAERTFDLIEYYMTTYDLKNKRKFDGNEIKKRKKALERLHIAPFFFTDQFTHKDFENLPNGMTEGDKYKWPDLTHEGYTLTLKQPSLDPKNKELEKGIIGDPAESLIKASGVKTSDVKDLDVKSLIKDFDIKSLIKADGVKSAPGNHAKIMIVDDELYVVGSDNLYPGFLSEFNYLIEGDDAVNELIKSYWTPLWDYSEPHDVNRNGKRVEDE